MLSKNTYFKYCHKPIKYNFKAILSKKRNKIRYYWKGYYLFDNAKQPVPLYLPSHEQHKKDEVVFQTIKFSKKMKIMCYTGWDVDRQRFICEGKSLKQRTNRKNKFIRDNWERLHGFADIKHITSKKLL